MTHFRRTGWTQQAPHKQLIRHCHICEHSQARCHVRRCLFFSAVHSRGQFSDGTLLSWLRTVFQGVRAVFRTPPCSEHVPNVLFFRAIAGPRFVDSWNFQMSGNPASHQESNLPGLLDSWNVKFPESSGRCLVTSEVTRPQDAHQQMRNDIPA